MDIIIVGRKWKAKYGGLDVSDAKRLRAQLRAKLRELAAERRAVRLSTSAHHIRT